MKYCLSARQPDSILKKVDEIKIELRDYQAIPEYIEKYADKTLILEFTNNIPKDFDWNLIAAYVEKMGGGFYCALSDLSLVPECALRNIKFYYKYAVTTLYELAALKEIGVSYALIGAPLMFDLKSAAAFKIPLRAIPNLAYEPYIKRKNGIIGGWVRPEDVDKYGEYISTFEFYAPKALDKEATLFKVYAENKTWPGNLNLLIENLDFDYDNRLFYDEEHFAERRIKCKQKCLSGHFCHYCIDQFYFVEHVLKKYRDLKSEN